MLEQTALLMDDCSNTPLPGTGAKHEQAELSRLDRPLVQNEQPEPGA
nr:hypothetical protein [Streptomyces sp. GbtcB7]